MYGAGTADGPILNWKAIHYTGAVSGLLLGLAYLIIIALYVPIGAPPATLDSLLLYLGGHEKTWWGIISLSVLTDFLFVPLAISIYFALRNVSVNLVLLSVACILLFVVLDLGITWPNYTSLMALSGRYLEARTGVEKLTLTTAAEPAAAVLHSTLLFVYNTLTLAVGVLLAGSLMLRGRFSKSVGYVGIAAGCVGIVSVLGSFFTNAVSSAIILASLLTTVWLLLVSYRFYQRGRYGALGPGCLGHEVSSPGRST